MTIEEKAAALKVPDCPIMGPMYISFLYWALGESEILEAFERDTGMRFPSPPRNAIEAMVDKATGCHEKTLIRFAEWAHDTMWDGELQEANP